MKFFRSDNFFEKVTSTVKDTIWFFCNSNHLKWFSLEVKKKKKLHPKAVHFWSASRRSVDSCSMNHAVWTITWLTWNRHNFEVEWENMGVKTVIYKVEIKWQFVSIENMCDQKRYFKVVEGSSQSLPLRIFSISCFESMDWFPYGFIYSKRLNKMFILQI